MTRTSCCSSGRKGRGYAARVKRLGFVVLLLLLACNHEQRQPAIAVFGGDPIRGKAAIDRYGCNVCHVIPGIDGAKGTVGPPLDHFAQRRIIAGKVPNNPQTLIQWLQNPPQFDPQTAMPNLGISPSDSRDIAAYLYTIK